MKISTYSGLAHEYAKLADAAQLAGDTETAATYYEYAADAKAKADEMLAEQHLDDLEFERELLAFEAEKSEFADYAGEDIHYCYYCGHIAEQNIGGDWICDRDECVRDATNRLRISQGG
jgi:hypothetical protein